LVARLAAGDKQCRDTAVEAGRGTASGADVPQSAEVAADVAEQAGVAAGASSQHLSRGGTLPAVPLLSTVAAQGMQPLPASPPVILLQRAAAAAAGLAKDLGQSATPAMQILRRGAGLLVRRTALGGGQFPAA
jgi:hypothetical protein